MDFPKVRNLQILLQKLLIQQRFSFIRVRYRTKSQRLHQQLWWRWLFEVLIKPGKNRRKFHSRNRNIKLWRNANHVDLNSWNQCIHLCIRIVDVLCHSFNRPCVHSVQNGQKTSSQQKIYLILYGFEFIIKKLWRKLIEINKIESAQSLKIKLNYDC